MNILDRVGIPKTLVWGYLGVLIFMMGDGLEAGWLSPYLVERGLSVQQASLLFTVYGVTLAIASWFSGVFLEAFGAKKSMLIGFIAYVIGTSAFIAFGITDLNYPIMLLTYAVKGFGYPLFAYSFLTWVTYRSPENKLSTAIGWFWVAYSGGMFVLGAYYSSYAIKHLGYMQTLWSAVVLAGIGAIFALLINRDRLPKKAGNARETLRELGKGLTIVKTHPKVGLSGIVRVINSVGSYGFPVFLPLHMAQYGIQTGTWLNIWGTIFLGNIVFNLLFGIIGDKFGWRQTVMWFGGVGCGIFTLLLFYVPEWTNGNLWITTIVGFIWGGLLAGYVPIAALAPSVAGGNKGPAMSIVNLGAGLSAFIAPAIAFAFIGTIGAEGVVWIFAILYFISAIITKFITTPEEDAAKLAGKRKVQENIA
ncbi:Alpha-ketoglutarate permease [Paenibacillus nuruki]|uniref:Alpha-ketoglutarate permease n=1 Tax=Paenibacillus nuruki TaxID=1886670 RepID=A0A1E3KX27_9BACL|nr:Alpha-ketoglutarate permease [Paenibacillus nuruki]